MDAAGARWQVDEALAANAPDGHAAVQPLDLRPGGLKHAAGPAGDARQVRVGPLAGAGNVGLAEDCVYRYFLSLCGAQWNGMSRHSFEAVAKEVVPDRAHRQVDAIEPAVDRRRDRHAHVDHHQADSQRTVRCPSGFR